MENIICNCKMVDEAEITEALSQLLVPDLAYIQQKTEAGTGCRRCVPALKFIIDRYVLSVQDKTESKKA